MPSEPWVVVTPPKVDERWLVPSDHCVVVLPPKVDDLALSPFDIFVVVTPPKVDDRAVLPLVSEQLVVPPNVLHWTCAAAAPAEKSSAPAAASVVIAFSILEPSQGLPSRLHERGAATSNRL